MQCLKDVKEEISVPACPISREGGYVTRRNPMEANFVEGILYDWMLTN
jgi:hypothetical protein